MESQGILMTATKRIIRKRDGFGATLRDWYIRISSLHPPFPEVREHNPDGITLLWPNWPHIISKGILSIVTLLRCIMDPFCKRQELFLAVHRTQQVVQYKFSAVCHDKNNQVCLKILRTNGEKRWELGR
jgi:hypothetical protein